MKKLLIAFIFVLFIILPLNVWAGAADLDGGVGLLGVGGGNVSDLVYDAIIWDGVTDESPSKNAVRDKIETLGSASISDTAYDATPWDGVTTISASKNAIRDKFVLVDTTLSAIPLDSDFGSNGLMERTAAGTYGIATDGTDYLSPTSFTTLIGAAYDTSGEFDTLFATKCDESVFGTSLDGVGISLVGTVLTTHDYLADIAGLTPAANNLIGWNGAGTDLENKSSLSVDITLNQYNILKGDASNDAEALALTTSELLGRLDADIVGIDIVTTIGDTDTKIPTEDAVDDFVKAGTATFTNKTFDTEGTGNAFKQFGYLQLINPHMVGAAVTAGLHTTDTDDYYGQVTFADEVETNNYVEYRLLVPPDFDSNVALTARFTFQLGGADTGDHVYKISHCCVAASASYTGVATTHPINLAYTADGSGADGDAEFATGTLTDWAGDLTASNLWVIRITRVGDADDAGDNIDASTVDSYSGPLVIRYGRTQ